MTTATDNSNSLTPTHMITKVAYLYANLQELLNKLLISMSSHAETVKTTLTDETGNLTVYNIPSLGHMFNEVNVLSKQMESLINLNDDTISMKYTDGTVRNFQMQKMSTLIDELEGFANTNVQMPEEFRVKNNWFFESFLNPALYVNINLASSVDSLDIDSFAVKRIIIEKDNATAAAYFDENVKGRTDLVLTTLMTDLDANDVPYMIDDGIFDRPASINRYKGSFAVIQILSDTATVDDVSVARKLYKLDQLKYYDLTSSEVSTKYLAKGDVLITSNDTEYEIVDINYDTRLLYLERVFGNDAIEVGTNVLKVKPALYRSANLQVGIGYNERNVIFIKPISSSRNMSAHDWNKGFAIYTNELNIKLQNGNVVSLADYYDGYVSDFSVVFAGYEKDSKIPASVGIQPDAPVLNVNNFNVELINSHVVNSTSQNDFDSQMASKEKTESDIKELDKTITNLKSKVNTSETLNKSEIQNLDKEINLAIDKKQKSTQQLTTLVNKLNYDIRTKPNMVVAPKYRLRGFWEIPAPKQSPYGEQPVVKFLISYRYLSKAGATGSVKEMPYYDKTGKSNTATFSNWVEIETKGRQKVRDAETGFYYWADEDTKDPDVININQLDIPINKGESVEVRIKSMSAAGYPENPWMSEWSDSVVVTFPDKFEMKDDHEVITQKLLVDESVLNFTAELSAKNLDLHLSDGFVKGNRYMSHKLSSIFSGWYAASGEMLDAQEKIKLLEDRIAALENAINKAKGTLKVTIIDTNGNVIAVNSGNTISLFAGYYKDIVTDDTGLDEGDVVTASYAISIENTSQTPLELVSRLTGGIDEHVLESAGYSDDYGQNRRYDLTSLMVSGNATPTSGSFKQKQPFQSGHARSQFMYTRYKDYGLVNNLVESDNELGVETYATYDENGFITALGNYDFRGNDAGGVTVPYNGYNYLPYDPAYDNGPADSDVWIGTMSGSPAEPDGNGYLNEFCIHKEHPVLLALTGTPDAIADLFRPEITSDQTYYPFAHGLHFEITKQEGTNAFGTAYYRQAMYFMPFEFISTTTDANFPVKIGFDVNDNYLIGKYTCGAYLFISPTLYEDISIDGNHTDIARKVVPFGPENAINVPLVFQFRCVDKLGYVGGYSADRTLANTEYSKKMGIDIYDRGDAYGNNYGSIFSFDVEVSCKYKQDTPNITPVAFVNKGEINKVKYSE